jgi:hypothetical protein
MICCFIILKDTEKCSSRAAAAFFLLYDSFLLSAVM